MPALLSSSSSASPGTLRTRRYRERRKSGSIFVRFEMTPAAVERLVELQFLSRHERHDPIAVTIALLKFGTRALWPAQRQ
jgi:hypothetical protein